MIAALYMLEPDNCELSTRANSLNKGKLGLTVTQGRVQITDLLIKTQD